MKRVIYCLLISIATWGPGCVEVAHAERYRNEEIFDLDIGGKVFREKACGKTCGVCGAAAKDCLYEGESLGCKFVFCKYHTSIGGHKFIYESRFKSERR